MAYLPLPPPAAGAPPGDAAIRDFMLDLGSRKEFRSLIPRGAAAAGEDRDPARAAADLGGFRLHGAQLFVANFENPDTPYTRLLLNWRTGTGKTGGGIGAALRFVEQFRRRVGVPPADRPSVTVIGFSRDNFLHELVTRPEFGYVSPEEVLELERLRARASQSQGTATPEVRQFGGYLGALRRRATDRNASRGYFQFYGYKEFVNRLFTVTAKGEAAQFRVQAMFYRERGDEEGTAFLDRIVRAVDDGLVRVNEDLVDDLRGGLIIADEIHNTYNMVKKNNYGVAIQYVLDRLGREGGTATPRAIFMTATVTGGNAAEIVDLLNLLIPPGHLPDGRPLCRRDFFRSAGEGGVVTLLPGALDRIGRLSAGRVSYQADIADDSAGGADGFPRQIFEGEPLAAAPSAPEIPYLRFIPCPMSPFHRRTLAHAIETDVLSRKGKTADGEGQFAVPISAASLLDIAYPNPDFPPDAARDRRGKSYGLFRSGETPSRLANAPARWREAAGIAVESLKGGELRAGVPALITGPFLELEGAKRPPVGAYSAKYAKLAKDVIDIVRGGPGKIMIYHRWVQMSGVLQIQELLKMNGFVDETSLPGPGTLCSVCGTPRKAHTKTRGHAFMPARFVLVTSKVDAGTASRSLARYDAPSNVDGYEYRVLVGSNIISEGFDLKAIRYQLIASMPDNVPTLIQVFGRAVRKGSHRDLPPDQRTVRVRLYVSVGGDGVPSLELERDAAKMAAYKPVQEIERVLRRYAVDSPLLRETPKTDTLKGLRYTPLVSAADVLGRPQTDTTFLAYGYGDREVATIAAAVRALFEARPVWTYDELWATLRRPGGVRGLVVAPQDLSEESFAIALARLGRHTPLARVAAGAGGAAIVRVQDFYVRVPRGADGRPVLDIESYVRADSSATFVPVRARVSDYVKEERATHNFGIRLALFEKKYSAPETVIEDMFVEYDKDFHYELLKQIVLARNDAGGAKFTARLGVPGGALARAEKLYRKFKVLLTYESAKGHPEALRILRGRRSSARQRPLGYVTERLVRVYVSGRWTDAPRRAFGFGPRYAENSIVVGYVERRGGRLRFKVRPPIQTLTSADVPDARSLAKGAVCETRGREELETLSRRLKVAGRGDLPALSGSDMCLLIRRDLLRREAGARASRGGMEDSPRWFYLFNDTLPTITLQDRR